MTSLLTHALAYLDHGFSVIPVNGKESAVRWTPWVGSVRARAAEECSFRIEKPIYEKHLHRVRHTTN